MRNLTDDQRKSLIANTKLREIVRDYLVKGQQNLRNEYGKAYYLAPKLADGTIDPEGTGFSDLASLKIQRDNYTRFSDFYYSDLANPMTKHLLVQSFSNFEYPDSVEGLSNAYDSEEKKEIRDELTDFIVSSTCNLENGVENIMERIIRQAYYEFTVKNIVLPEAV